MMRLSVGLCAVACTVVCAGAQTVSAQDLVYTPINPSFGGNPLNSSHLLGVANAQNDHTAPARPALTQAEQFRRQLESRVLSAVARQVTDAIFGETVQDFGRFEFNGQTITFDRGLETIRVVISDDATGGETVIEVPVGLGGGG